MAEIYAKLMLGPLTDPPKSHKSHTNVQRKEWHVK